MEFKKDCMKEEYVKQISEWRYEEPYTEYNLSSYEELKNKNANILNPDKKDNYICYIQNGIVIAYTNIGKKADNNVFLGIGLAPEYCGKGLGKQILLDSIEEIKNRYEQYHIMLQVRAWNIRAIKCYRHVGFTVVKKEIVKDHNGVDTEFIFLEYK